MREPAWESAPKGNSPEEAPLQPLSNTVAPAVSDDNSIYFYGEVSQDTVLNLNRDLRYKARSIAALQKSMDMTGGHIHLYINSPGGSLLQGLAALDTIRASTIPVVTVIDGMAASAATIMSVAGKHRIMYKHSHMLIHQLSNLHWGNFEQLKDDMKNSERFMEMIKNIYREYTKIPPKLLEDILKHDLWWDAKTCLKYGLVDKII